VQRDRPPQQQRRQQVPLELLHQHGDADDDQRGGEALGDEGDQRRQRAGHERADQWQERGDEGEEGQRDGQRDAEDDQPEADEEPVDQPDGGLAAQVAADRGGRAAADLAEVAGSRLADEVEDPAGEPRRVLDEEEGQEQRQDQPGDDLAEQGRAPHRAPGDAAGVLPELLPGLVQVAVQVLLAEPERPRGDELVDVPDPLVDAVAEGSELVADERHEAGDDRGQRQHGAGEHGQDRAEVPPAAALQPLDQGHQQGRQEQGDDHRDDHDLEQDEQVEHRPGGGDHHQQAPAPGGQPGQRRRDLGTLPLARRVRPRLRPGRALAHGATLPGVARQVPVPAPGRPTTGRTGTALARRPSVRAHSPTRGLAALCHGPRGGAAPMPPAAPGPLPPPAPPAAPAT